MKKYLKSILILLLATIVCSALVSCKNYKLKTNENPQTAETENTGAAREIMPSAVKVLTVSAGSVSDYSKFGGTVTARTTVAALPDINGKVVELNVKIGDYVGQNQVIGKIDASRAGQTYNLSPVKAPISGTITSVPVSIGAQASPASPFAMIQTLDDLEISFNVIEKYITKVAYGNPVSVTFDAFENEVFSAYISEINPTVDPETRTLSVKAKLSRNDSRVKAGMFARLTVLTQTKNNVILVPYSALTVTADESYCFVVEGNIAKKKVVTTGIKEGNYVEITSGLNLGDQLVVRGQNLLSDSQSVRVL